MNIVVFRVEGVETQIFLKMYHSTVMQRLEDEEESTRMDRISGNTRASPQTQFHPAYSPTNGNHPRPHFPAPAAPSGLPMPGPSHISVPPASPRTVTPYQSDYQPAREKPTSNYYDPTSDSSERRPSESAGGWTEGHKATPQVRGCENGQLGICALSIKF